MSESTKYSDGTRKTVAEEVVTRLLSRLTLPDDLVRLIYYKLLELGPGPHPLYDKYGYPDFQSSDRVIVHYVTTLYEILSKVPPIGETGTFRVRIRDFVPLTMAEAFSLTQMREVGDKEVNNVTGNPISKLRGTVYYLVLNHPVYINIPLDLFFQHAHVLGASGYGKTVLIERLTYQHIREEVCVIAMAPKGLLLPQLAMLDYDLSRLTYVSPALWGKRAMALNPFKVFGDRTLSAAEENHVCDLINYLFSDVEPTDKQQVLLDNCTRLLVKVPRANLETLYELMACDKFPDEYHRFIDHSDKLQVAFFLSEFGDKKADYGPTKSQLKWRIQRLLGNPLIRDSFTQDRCDFDLMDLINRPSVILIDTSLQHAGFEGSRFLGRFFFALLTMAMRIRGAGRKHFPVVAYIDECATYLDENLTTMLELARDARIGLVLIHQQLSQLRAFSSSLEASLKSNTRIKFIGKVDHSDATTLSHAMRVDAGALEHQDEFRFYLKYTSAPAIPLFAPPGYLARKPRREISTLERKLLADSEEQTKQEEPEAFKSLTYSAQHYSDNDIE